MMSERGEPLWLRPSGHLTDTNKYQLWHAVVCSLGGGANEVEEAEEYGTIIRSGTRMSTSPAPRPLRPPPRQQSVEANTRSKYSDPHTAVRRLQIFLNDAQLFPATLPP